MRLKLYALCLVFFTACSKDLTPIGNIDSVFRLDAGRVIIKKVKLPNYNLQPKVTVSTTLTSNGDPWDKSGSLFVIPKASKINVIDFETGNFDLKKLNNHYFTVKKDDSLGYVPNVELIRFMTPFGIGYFNNDERFKNRKPPYIPKWEDKVEWKQDITHLLPFMEEEVYVGVYIDTWTKEGYNISVDLDFSESQIPNHKKEKQIILPLVNTVKYESDQVHYDVFAKQPVEVDFYLKTKAKNAKLYFITTGHGGHSGGDEFVKKQHQIYLDGKNLKTWTPWRDDCASFRRFNPTSGTWKAKQFFKEEMSEDMIASSDFSRSNWCPGSQVLPEIIDLGNLESGKHTLKVAIPKAQISKENENNYWMVSAYIVYNNE